MEYGLPDSLRHREAKAIVQGREVGRRGVGSRVYNFTYIIDQNMSSVELSFKGG